MECWLGALKLCVDDTSALRSRRSMWTAKRRAQMSIDSSHPSQSCRVIVPPRGAPATDVSPGTTLPLPTVPHRTRRSSAENTRSGVWDGSAAAGSHSTGRIRVRETDADADARGRRKTSPSHRRPDAPVAVHRSQPELRPPASAPRAPSPQLWRSAHRSRCCPARAILAIAIESGEMPRRPLGPGARWSRHQSTSGR